MQYGSRNGWVRCYALGLFRVSTISSVHQISYPCDQHLACRRDLNGIDNSLRSQNTCHRCAGLSRKMISCKDAACAIVLLLHLGGWVHAASLRHAGVDIYILKPPSLCPVPSSPQILPHDSSKHEFLGSAIPTILFHICFRLLGAQSIDDFGKRIWNREGALRGGEDLWDYWICEFRPTEAEMSSILPRFNYSADPRTNLRDLG